MNEVNARSTKAAPTVRGVTITRIKDLNPESGIHSGSFQIPIVNHLLIVASAVLFLYKFYKRKFRPHATTCFCDPD